MTICHIKLKKHTHTHGKKEPSLKKKKCQKTLSLGYNSTSSFYNQHFLPVVYFFMAFALTVYKVFLKHNSYFVNH